MEDANADARARWTGTQRHTLRLSECSAPC